MRRVAFISLLCLSPAHAFQNFAPIREQWQLETAHQGFFTSTNYNANRNMTSLASGHNYKHFLFKIDASYNITDHLSLLGDIGLAHAMSSDGSFQRTTTAGTDAGFGLQYLWRSRFVWLAPAVYFSYPLSTVERKTDQALVSEGAMQITGKLNFLKIWTRYFQSYGSIGYTHRDDNRNALIPYQFATRFRLKRPWLGFEIRGYESFDQDAFSASYRKQVTDRVNGGSLRYYSAEASIAEALLTLEYPWNRSWVSKLAGGATVSGIDSAQGALYLITLNYSFGGSEESVDYFHLANHYKREKRQVEKQVKKFRIKDEDDDDPFLYDE